jgi:hypothetical protein
MMIIIKLNERLNDNLNQIKGYLSDFKQKVVENLKEISNKNKSTSNDILINVESNIGYCFYQLSHLHENFNKVNF